MNHQKSKYTVFCNAAHKMINLNGKDRLILDYLCERMDKTNRITIDKDQRISFQTFVKHVTSNQRGITKGQFIASVKKLLMEELIFRKRKGLYVVSPKHFTKATLKSNRSTFNLFQNHLEETTEDKTLLSIPRVKQTT